MSFWDSKNLPIYNLKGGFMLPQYYIGDSINAPLNNDDDNNTFMLDQYALKSSLRPGNDFNLPQPATSTGDPNTNNSNNSDNDNAVSRMLSRFRDPDSSEEKGFLSNVWSKLTGDSTSESDDERTVSSKSEVCSPCSPTDVNKGDNCDGCDGFLKTTGCRLSKITKDCDKKKLKEKYLKYKKKYLKAKYNIDL